MYLTPNKEDFNKLLSHAGHRIEIVTYGTLDDIRNVSIECVDCNEVIVDMDNPDGGNYVE